MAECSVLGCSKQVKTRGMCGMHSMRVQRTGDAGEAEIRTDWRSKPRERCKRGHLLAETERIRPGDGVRYCHRCELDNRRAQYDRWTGGEPLSYAELLLMPKRYLPRHARGILEAVMDDARKAAAWLWHRYPNELLDAGKRPWFRDARPKRPGRPKRQDRAA